MPAAQPPASAVCHWKWGTKSHIFVSCFWTILRAVCSYFIRCSLCFRASHKHPTDHRCNLSAQLIVLNTLTLTANCVAGILGFVRLQLNPFVRSLEVPSGWGLECVAAWPGLPTRCLAEWPRPRCTGSSPGEGHSSARAPACCSWLLLRANELPKSSTRKCMLQWELW